MALALAVALKINPFYLSAEEEDSKDYSEEKIFKFIKSKNMINLVETDENTILKRNLIKSFEMIIDNIDENKLLEIEKIAKDDLLVLLNSLLIKDKLTNSQIKSLLIKIILTE